MNYVLYYCIPWKVPVGRDVDVSRGDCVAGDPGDRVYRAGQQQLQKKTSDKKVFQTIPPDV